MTYDERNPPPICDDYAPAVPRRTLIKHRQLNVRVTCDGHRYVDGLPEHPEWWDGSGLAEYRLDGAYPEDSGLISALKADPGWMYAPKPHYQWYGLGAEILHGSKVRVGDYVVGVHRHDESVTYASIGEHPIEYDEFDDPYQRPFEW